jgi:hypothetical protein
MSSVCHAGPWKTLKKPRKPWKNPPPLRSALAVLASSSGVSSERAAFMGLVRNEIDRLNEELVSRGSVSMIFQRGNVTVRAQLAAGWPEAARQICV